MSKILVIDLDETLTRGGEDRVKPHVREALFSLKKSGWTLILATGRDRRYLMRRDDIEGIFDAWVTESGISVYLPESGIYEYFVDESWRMLVKKLRALPFVEEKENTVAFKSEYLDVIEAEVSKLGIRAVFRDNKGTILLLPEGVNKAFGVREAMKLLKVDGFIAAIGDSEVDLELLELADFKAVVANADPSLMEKADYVAEREDGDGVVEIIRVLSSRVY